MSVIGVPSAMKAGEGASRLMEMRSRPAENGAQNSIFPDTHDYI